MIFALQIPNIIPLMIPLLSLAAANLGRNMLQTAIGQIQKPQDPQSSADPAAFQKCLAKVASSPEVQRASFLASEGVYDLADAEQKLGDLGSRVIQDPEIQNALAGSTGPVDIRFQPDGSVSVTTAEGQTRTVHLSGDAKESAGKAALIAQSVRSSSRMNLQTPAFQPAVVAALPPGIRITPGSVAVSHLL